MNESGVLQAGGGGGGGRSWLAGWLVEVVMGWDGMGRGERDR